MLETYTGIYFPQIAPMTRNSMLLLAVAPRPASVSISGLWPIDIVNNFCRLQLNSCFETCAGVYFPQIAQMSRNSMLLLAVAPRPASVSISGLWPIKKLIRYQTRLSKMFHFQRFIHNKLCDIVFADMIFWVWTAFIYTKCPGFRDT
jgi:hypothetical protein